MSDRLTAMDIEKQEFAKKRRGYDTEEVHMYLTSVAAEIERLNLENSDRAEQLARVRAELEKLSSREQMLQQTLVTAQKMTEEMKGQAEKQADIILKDARLRADSMLRDAQDRLLRLEADISRSKLERESFEHRLRSVIDQHLTLLDMRRQARGDLDNLRVLPNQRIGTEAG